MNTYGSLAGSTQPGRALFQFESNTEQSHAGKNLNSKSLSIAICTSYTIGPFEAVSIFIHRNDLFLEELHKKSVSS